MAKERKETGIYKYLVKKTLLAFGVLLIAQVAFYLSNTRIFHVDGFGEWMGILWGNIIFCAATVCTLLSPYLLMMLLPIKARWKRWYRIIAEILYIVAVLLMLVPRGANMAYYQYTYRLLSSEIFSYLGISGQMGSLAPHFAADYWYAWAIPLAIAVLFLVADSRLHLAKPRRSNFNLSNNMVGLLSFAVVVWFCARGGFGHFIRPTDAAHHCQPKNTALVSNDAYNILRTLFVPDLEEVDYPGNAYIPIHTPSTEAQTDTIDSLATQPRNVMLIILESFGQEWFGCYNTQANADTRTPFLDSLAQHSTLFDGRSNGKKSIEGVTAITTSIPNLMSTPLTNSVYADNDIVGLPAILKRHGYYSAFFHGSYNGVMGFDSTCARIGFDEYLGMNEYNADPMARPEDYDGVWGIFDEPFLQYTVRHMGTFKEPFLSAVFTVTSHHPFPIPDNHKGQFAEGRHPILKCVEYTDFALRRFFDEAKRQPWYGNTLFIICGDHSGHGLTPEYNDYDGWYRIPMIVFDPQQPVGRRSSRIVQQIDIMPSIVDYLGFDDTFVCFGNSVIQQPEHGWQVYYGNGYHTLVSNNPFDPSKHDVSIVMGDVEIGEPNNIAFLKAIIKQYNSRVINNKLTLE